MLGPSLRQSRPNLKHAQRRRCSGPRTRCCYGGSIKGLHERPDGFSAILRVFDRSVRMPTTWLLSSGIVLYLEMGERSEKTVLVRPVVARLCRASLAFGVRGVDGGPFGVNMAHCLPECGASLSVALRKPLRIDWSVTRGAAPRAGRRVTSVPARRRCGVVQRQHDGLIPRSWGFDSPRRYLAQDLLLPAVR